MIFCSGRLSEWKTIILDQRLKLGREVLGAKFIPKMNSSRDQMHAIVRALPQFGWVGRVTGVHFSLILSLIGVKFFLQDMFLMHLISSSSSYSSQFALFVDAMILQHIPLWWNSNSEKCLSFSCWQPLFIMMILNTVGKQEESLGEPTGATFRFPAPTYSGGRSHPETSHLCEFLYSNPSGVLLGSGLQEWVSKRL